METYDRTEEDTQELERWDEGYNEFEQWIDANTDGCGNCYSDADTGL